MEVLSILVDCRGPERYAGAYRLFHPERGQHMEASAAVVSVSQGLSAAEARALTEELRAAVETARGAAERVYELLERAREGRAFAALGYETWEGYVEGELGVTRQRAFQVMQEGSVVRQLKEALPEVPSNAFDVSGRAAREIAHVLDQVVAGVRKRVSGGAQPAIALAETVREIREAASGAKPGKKRVFRRFRKEDREEPLTPSLVRWYERHSHEWRSWKPAERQSAALGLYRLAGEVRRLQALLKEQSRNAESEP